MLDATSLDREGSEGGLRSGAIIETLGETVRDELPDATIQSWSVAAERLYGYRAEEIVGMPARILVPAERVDEIEEILTRLRRGEAIERFETVRLDKHGDDVHVALTISPVRNPAGEIIGVSTIALNTGSRKRRDEIQSFLTESSRLFAVSLDYRETLSRVAHLMLSGLADWCMVETADAEGAFTQVAVAHRDPAMVELARRMRRLYPPDAARSDIPLRVLTTGRSELIAEVSDTLLKNTAQNADHLRMLRELGPKSLIVVPMRVRERMLGTILLANRESGRRFSLTDLELAEDLAQRAALAVDNARLHESELEARRASDRSAEWVGRLHAVTASLSAAVTPTEVAAVIVSEGAAAVGAAGGLVRLFEPVSRRLRLLAAAGSEESARKSLPSTSSRPEVQVFRAAEERYFESAAALLEAAPTSAHGHVGASQEAIAFVPLRAARGPIGVMALSFATSKAFDIEERERLRALAVASGQALERACLYEAEQQARALAEFAIERTSQLQVLAAELAESLTSAQVAEVAVAQGIASVSADAGALQLLSDDGTMLEVVNAQGANPTLVNDAWHQFSTDLKLPSTDALHTREPVFIESEKDIRDHYAHVEEYPHGREAKAGLRARAGAHIPLVLSGRSLGVLFLGFSEARAFSDSQRSFMMALGRQCAQALKRAQLYEAELEGRGELNRLLERLHEGVFSVDRRGRVAFASSKAKQMLSPASLEEGGGVPEKWHAFPLRSFVANLFERDEAVVEAQVVSSDGDRVFDVTGIPAVRSDAVLLVVTDVSERERRQRAEREFIDNAAHELRTPLAAITSAIERLQAGARDVPEKRDRFLGHIQHESGRLNRLASSLLVLARAQAQSERPRREAIVLRELLDELLAGVDVGDGVELALDCSPGLVISSNRDLLEHALLNVVNNAAHHTDVGRIRVSGSAERDGSVTIEVSDSGSGIAHEEIERLFDRFYRGPREEGRSGFGLGLPITKEAVEALGGTVEIESVVGAGTTARISLPSVGLSVPA